LIADETAGSSTMPSSVSFAPSNGMLTDASSTITADIVFSVSRIAASA